jgi:cell division protease FtsH
MKQSYKTALRWLVLLAIVVVVIQIITAETQPGSELAFSDFRAAVEAGQVTEVVVHGDGRIVGELNEDGAQALAEGRTTFETVGRVSDDLQDLMQARGVTFTFKRDEQSIWQPILSIGLPILLISVLFFFFMRQMQSGGGRVFFTSRRTRSHSTTSPVLTSRSRS